MVKNPKEKNLSELFSTQVIDWYHQHGRKTLPWQGTSLYHTWISEIMLQQTQVTTVERYYPRFVEKFPTVQSLAAAPIDEVLHLWSGLGYYARARNLHKAASIMGREGVPDHFDRWMTLPGVGRSTAGAVLSLGAGKPYPILEGNVRRILTRYFGCSLPRGSALLEKKLWAYSEVLTPEHQVAAFNQGMMDIGSLLCKRRSPLCARCPLRPGCFTAQDPQRALVYPQPRIKRKKPLKKQWFVVVVFNDSVWLKKNASQALWHSLYCFPAFGTLAQAKIFLKFLNIQHQKKLPPFFHQFTHLTLHIHPIIVYLSAAPNVLYSKLDPENPAFFYSLATMAPIGLPAPVIKLLSLIREGKIQ